ncbi:hypothetical protein HDU96_008477, partial [Phlyctochytrium bullatum]
KERLRRSRVAPHAEPANEVGEIEVNDPMQVDEENQPVVQGNEENQPVVQGNDPVRPPFTKRQILHCKREIPNDNQPDEGGEPQVLVLYEVTSGCQEYTDSELQNRNNFRLRQVRVNNAENAANQELQRRYCEPITTNNGNLGLVVNRDLNSANNFRNLLLRYMAN